jgi:hypothetical protein
MPIARIVTRHFHDALEFAENLRSRFSTIEIAAPDHPSTGEVELEIRLDECTPQEALGRVLEYLADHPFAEVESNAVEAADAQCGTQTAAPVVQPVVVPVLLGTNVVPVAVDHPADAKQDVATVPAAAMSLETHAADAHRSWVKSLRSFFRVRYTHSATTELPIAKREKAAAHGGAKPRRDDREAQFWVPPAYKEGAWTEAERRRREELERSRLAEIALQRQRAAEARKEMDRQIAMQLAAERERLAREEQQRRAREQEERRLAAIAARKSEAAQNKADRPDAVTVPVASAMAHAVMKGVSRVQTITPRLQAREARLWKQATIMATAVAVLIALAITGYANRRPSTNGPVEVEREPVQPTPVKPASDEGSGSKSSPVLLTSAENEPNRGERANSPAPTWHRRAGRDEVDYIARDVTIRYFDRGNSLVRASNGDTGRSRNANAVVKEVSNLNQGAGVASRRHSVTGIKTISDLDHN